MNFLIFGTLWFWILLVLTSGIIIWLLEDALTNYSGNGGGGWATIVLIAAFIAYYFFGSKDDITSILVFVRDNPIRILQYFGAYIIIGTIWAFIKWYFFVNNELQKLKGKIFSKYGSIDIPRASQNKYRILSWMYYWPFSSLWTLINEPLRKSFEFVYSKIGGTFDKISDKIFGDLIKEQESHQESHIEKLKEIEERNGLYGKK
jgi:hypothetical protein